MHLLNLNAAGKQLAPAQTLAPSRRRLSQVVGRHVDRSRPHMIAVQRARDPLQPIDEAWVVRGRDRVGAVKPWPRMYLPADAIVVVVYLPLGGGGASSGGSSSKSPLSIALGIAAVALVAFAGPLGGVAAGAFFGGSTLAGTLITGGLVVGSGALLSLASRSKANKQATDTTQVYGVAGGGNLPKPGDRIPRGYGRLWMKPDLSQPDFSQYDGDDQILFKRQAIGVGRYRPYAVRAGKQVIWQEGPGFVAPFDDTRNAIEFVAGTASTLVPNANVAASGIGGLLPRPAEIPNVAGPFLINQRGALVTRLQVDFQFPQGISRTDFLKKTTRSNQPAAWAVQFEYAPIDEGGGVVGGWQTLYNGNSGAEGARFATHPLRYTKFLDVPAGRYAVRGRNVQPDTSAATTGTAAIDAVQWDGASGWVADAAIRPGITELCLRVYATKGSQAAAFGEIEVDASAIIPVWTGTAWVEQETSKAVWAYLDIMRNADYGGALPDSQLDLGTALGYAQRLTEFDTFDGVIRGPVSVYEAAATALLPMRAEPVHLGRYWSLVRDEPKSVRRHVITRRQILKGSTQVVFDLDTASGAGHVIGEFDQGGDYRSPNQATAIYGEASLTPTRQRWTGVKTYAHAQHLTRWRAAAGAYRRQTTPFGVEMEGRIYKRGDSIAVDPWFVTARKVAGIVRVAGSNLVVDVDVPIAANDAVVMRDRTGREWGPVLVAGQGANLREIRLDTSSRAQVEAATGIAMTSVLSDGRNETTTILVGQVSTLQENYLIQSVKPAGPDRAQVEALIDDPRVWAVIGAVPVVPPTGANGLADPESPSILRLTANAVQIAAGLRCDYAIQPGRGARRFEVGLSYDGGNHYESIYQGTATTGAQVLNPVDPTTVMLRARAFGATGLPGLYTFTSLVIGTSGLGIDVPPIEYADLDDVFRERIDQIEATKTRVEEIRVQLEADVAAAQARADSIRADLTLSIAAQADRVAQVKQRAEDLRNALSFDPSVRATVFDPVLSGLRGDVEMLVRAANANAAAMAQLGDQVRAAGLEVIPGEGRVRIYAIDSLATATARQITNLSVTVDALSGKIDLYGSTQTGGLDGLINQITTVQTSLDALQGTITDKVSIATFDGIASRVSTAETRLDAADASILLRATTSDLTAAGNRLTQAELRIDAAEGVIFQQVLAGQSDALDRQMLSGTLGGLVSYLGSGLGSVQQDVAIARQTITASVDTANRSIAESRLDLVVYRGSVSAQFSQVFSAIATGDSAQASALSLLDTRVGKSEAAITTETKARSDADTATASTLTSLTTSVGANASAITTETNARTTADSGLATSITNLSVEVGANATAITQEADARADADSATATTLTSLTTKVGTNTTAITTETKARSDADTAFGTSLTNLTTKVGTVETSVTTEATARSNADTAMGSTLSNLTTKVGTVETSVTNEAKARSDADTAFGQTLSSLNTSVGNNATAITNEAKARTDADTAFGQTLSTLSTKVGTVESSVTTEAKARSDADTAFGQTLSSLNTSVGNNATAISNEATARANADTATGRTLTSLSTSVDDNATAITNEATARSNADTAIASSVTDVLAKTNRGTAGGRLAFTAVSAPSGVASRVALQVSTAANGTLQNAGMLIDVVSGGARRILFDADYFAISANGGQTYPFEFDGDTLSIPKLRVTQSIIAPNATSDKLVKTAPANFAAGASSGNWIEVPDTAINFTADGTGWGALWGSSTNLYVEANGTNSASSAGTLQIAVAINNNPYNGRASNSVSSFAGNGLANNTNKTTGLIGSSEMEIFGPGAVKLSLMYNFQGDGGASGKIISANLKVVLFKR